MTAPQKPIGSEPCPACAPLLEAAWNDGYDHGHEEGARDARHDHERRRPEP